MKCAYIIYISIICSYIIMITPERFCFLIRQLKVFTNIAVYLYIATYMYELIQ